MSEEIPEIGLKVGSAEEKAWTILKEGCEKEIATNERIKKMNHVLIKLCDEMIAKEQTSSP